MLLEMDYKVDVQNFEWTRVELRMQTFPSTMSFPGPSHRVEYESSPKSDHYLGPSHRVAYES